MRLYEIYRPESQPSGRPSYSMFDAETVWYHGSKVSGFWEFDRAFLGSGIVNTNSSGGFYFASDRDAAQYFADEETTFKDSDGVWNYDDINVYGDDGEYYFLIGYNEEDAMSSEFAWVKDTEFDNRRIEVNRGPYNTTGAAHAAGRVIVDQFNAAKKGDTFYYDDKTIAVYLALGNSLVLDNFDHFRQAERTAQSKGYDSIVVRDIFDGRKHSDVAVVFDPKRIRII